MAYWEEVTVDMLIESIILFEIWISNQPRSNNNVLDCPNKTTQSTTAQLQRHQFQALVMVTEMESLLAEVSQI